MLLDALSLLCENLLSSCLRKIHKAVTELIFEKMKCGVKTKKGGFFMLSG